MAVALSALAHAVMTDLSALEDVAKEVAPQAGLLKMAHRGWLRMNGLRRSGLSRFGHQRLGVSIIKNAISESVQRLLAARHGPAEASASIDPQSLRRIQDLALGCSVAVGAITPILAAMALSPIAANLASGSVLFRVLVNAMLVVAALVVASAVHGAMLHWLTRRELSRQQARRS